MKPFTNSIIMVTLAVLLSAPATAFQLKVHDVEISRKSTTEIPVSNTLNSPIIVKITPPDGVQVFPRRFQLLPGERQVVKARERDGKVLSQNAKMAFSYAVQSEEKQGVHSRITLRLPVREVSR
ncbi:Fimbria/pilus periplasmic chaperone [Vibrio cholerae]